MATTNNPRSSSIVAEREAGAADFYEHIGLMVSALIEATREGEAACGAASPLARDPRLHRVLQHLTGTTRELSLLVNAAYDEAFTRR